MNLPPRQQSIIEEVRERGYLSIEEMAQMFAVTPQTIRRDINQLAEQGLLRRCGLRFEHREHRLHHARRPDA